MLESKEIELDGMKFQLNPLKGFKALRLDKKVVSLCMPLIEGVQSMDEDIDLSKALTGLTSAIDNMKDADYEKFVTELLSTTIYIPTGAPPVEITPAVIDDHFQGASTVVYKLMFEVMKYNQFTPFVLAGRVGQGTLSTLISEKLTGEMKK